MAVGKSRKGKAGNPKPLVLWHDDGGGGEGEGGDDDDDGGDVV